MDRGFSEAEAEGVGTLLADDLRGTLRPARDGDGSVTVEVSDKAVARDAGPWRQAGRRITLTGRDPRPGAFAFDGIERGIALRLDLPIGEDAVILSFQATSRTGDEIVSAAASTPRPAVSPASPGSARHVECRQPAASDAQRHDLRSPATLSP